MVFAMWCTQITPAMFRVFDSALANRNEPKACCIKSNKMAQIYVSFVTNKLRWKKKYLKSAF